MSSATGSLGGPAAEHWAQALAEWAIPEHIRAAAPTSPHRFDVETFAAAAADAVARGPTPTTERALAALPEGGSVLDVGCGGGATSLGLAGRAGELVGVDESAGMLEAYTTAAERLGVASRTVCGRWPDVAGEVGVADVAVCGHVAYNAPDLPALLTALDTHAAARVVVELTAVHPLAWTAPFWRGLHGIDRPSGPTAEDAVAVAAQLGFAVGVERWTGPFRLGDEDPEEVVAFLRRRLCVGVERDVEIRALLDRHMPDNVREVVTMWWDTT